MFRILLLTASITLVACGKTGELYLPEAEPATIDNRADASAKETTK